MELTHLIAQVVFATVALAFLLALGSRAIRFAKKGTPGAHVLGAAFLFFSMGNFRDPTDEMVQEAKKLKRRDENESGDPPDGHDPGHGK
jgi:multisubunit Na+/H+ antiporter MnhB subunit